MNIPFNEFSISTSQHIGLNGHVRRTNDIRRISEEEEEMMTIGPVHVEVDINSRIFRAPRTNSTRCAARTSLISQTNKVNISESAAQSALKAAYEVLDRM